MNSSSLKYYAHMRCQLESYYRKGTGSIPPDLYIATLEGSKTPEQDVIEQERWQGLC